MLTFLALCTMSPNISGTSKHYATGETPEMRLGGTYRVINRSVGPLTKLSFLMNLDGSKNVLIITHTMICALFEN